MKLSTSARYFLIAAIVVFIDQFIKVVVKLNMELGSPGAVPVIDGFLSFFFVENNGAAFGLTLGNIISGIVQMFNPEYVMPEDTSKLLLSLFSLVAAGGIGWYLHAVARHRSAMPMFVALILGGALGNIIDRIFYGVWFADINDYEGGIFYGRVVDFIYFDLGDWDIPSWVPIWGGNIYPMFPIFNIADIAISVGICTLIAFQGRYHRRHRLRLRAEALERIRNRAQDNSQLDQTSLPDNSILS